MACEQVDGKKTIGMFRASAQVETLIGKTPAFRAQEICISIYVFVYIFSKLIN